MSKQYNLLTIRQASKLVDGLTEYRIRRLIKNNELPYIKSGNRVLINEQEIYNYLVVAQKRG